MRALPYLGVVLLWSLTAGGVAFAVDQALQFDDALLENTRTPIPGKRTLKLKARRYNVFFEAPDIAHPDRVGERLDDPAASPLGITVRDPRTERELRLKGYSGTFTMSGRRDSTAVASFEVPRQGSYEVSVSSSEDLPYANPTIALGEPIGKRVIRIVGGIVVAVVALLAGALLLIVTLVVRSRRPA